MKKIFVFLGLSLLCWGSSFAQEREASTQVDPKAIKSYSDLTKVVKTVSNLVDWQTQKTTLENEQKNDIEPEYASPIPQKKHYVSDVYNYIKNYVLARDGQTYKSDSIDICYRVLAKKESNLPGEVPVLYVYITSSKFTNTVNQQTKTNGSISDNVYTAWIKSDWTTVNLNKILENTGTADYKISTSLSYIDEETEESVSKPIQPSYLRLCFPNPQNQQYKEIQKDLTTPRSYFQQAGYTNALKDLTTFPTNYGLIVEETIYPESNPHKAWKERQTVRANQLTQINQNLSEIDEYYKTATNPFIIAANIEVPTEDKANLVWPANRTLNGGNNMISGNLPLFNTNNGTITNLIAPDGHIAENNKGTAKACIIKVDDETYRVYDTTGKDADYATLEQAIYRMRNNFGYSLVDDGNGGVVGATGAVTDATKLYEAKYIDAAHKDKGIYTFHVNIGETDFIYNKAAAQAANRLPNGIKRDNNNVIYINNTDAKEKTNDWTNVAIRNSATEETYTCQNITLADGEGTDEFYVPLKFTAKNLTYKREFKSYIFTVCLPFKLTESMKTNLATKAGSKNITYYTFKEVDGKTVWFNPISEVEANTPCVIAFDKTITNPGVIFDGISLGDIDIASTSEASLAVKPTNSDKYTFFGNYKHGQYAPDLANASTQGVGSNIYAFQNGNVVLVPYEETTNDDGTITRKGSRLHQFRSYIRLEEDLLNPGATPNSFNIGLLDEDGNVVTGIESVESGKEANGFKAVGGNSAIEISTDKACEVKVYTASGSLVKAVHVEAGNTTLPFGAGMYIVNQTKVVVK